MLKKFVDKRIELFKELFPDWKESTKTDAIYVRINPKEQKVSKFHNGMSITKNTLHKLGTKIEFTQHVAEAVFLITAKGKLMYKSYDSAIFKAVGMKSLYAYGQGVPRRNDLAKIFFIGRKYEWMKDYKNLWAFRFFKSFSSLKEAKMFLGYSFLSDKQFYEMFWLEPKKEILEILVLADNKPNAHAILEHVGDNEDDFYILKDYIEMCYKANIPVRIPRGMNRVKKYHEKVTLELSKRDMDAYSDKQKFFPEFSEEQFEDIWRQRGLDFVRLNTPREMFEEGIRQNHCIGVNYSDRLHNQSFYSFTHENKVYTLQLYPSGNLGQFYGYKNIKKAPQELLDLVKNEVNLVHNIVDSGKDIPNYPYDADKITQDLPW